MLSPLGSESIVLRGLRQLCAHLVTLAPVPCQLSRSAVSIPGPAPLLHPLRLVTCPWVSPGGFPGSNRTARPKSASTAVRSLFSNTFLLLKSLWRQVDQDKAEHHGATHPTPGFPPWLPRYWSLCSTAPRDPRPGHPTLSGEQRRVQEATQAGSFKTLPHTLGRESLTALPPELSKKHLPCWLGRPHPSPHRIKGQPLHSQRG